MSVIFILITISVFVAGLFLAGFIWATKNGQFEDEYTPSVRILFDDPKIAKSKENKEQKEK